MFKPFLRLLVLLFVFGTGISKPATHYKATSSPYPKKVLVSWYGKVYKGRKTSSGLRFNPEEFVAANRTLPFGTLVRLTYIKTGKSVIVRIIDRGPMNPHWEFDISSGAAKEIGLLRDGVGKVEAEVLPTDFTCSKFGCLKLK